MMNAFERYSIATMIYRLAALQRGARAMNPEPKTRTPLRLRCFDCGGKDFVMVVEKDGFAHHYVRITCVDCRREYWQILVMGKGRAGDAK